MIDLFAKQFAEGFAPEDVQGVLCGTLCAHSATPREIWLNYLEVDPADQTTYDVSDQAEQIVQDTLQALSGQALQFDLLLPDDDYPLERRVDALVNWCQGFLVGLSLAGRDDPADLSAAAAEIHHDFLELTHAQLDADQTEEEGERAYVELVEYVRTAAQVMFVECDPEAADTDDAFLDKPVH